MMGNEITEAFLKVFDAIDECVEDIRNALRKEAIRHMDNIVTNALLFQKELEERIPKPTDPLKLRSECLVFLRDYGIKESRKGTEYLISILLAHRSDENLKLKEIYQVAADKYQVSLSQVRGSIRGAIQEIAEEDEASTKEVVYMIMRDWEFYKQDKGLV